MLFSVCMMTHEPVGNAKYVACKKNLHVKPSGVGISDHWSVWKTFKLSQAEKWPPISTLDVTLVETTVQRTHNSLSSVKNIEQLILHSHIYNLGPNRIAYCHQSHLHHTKLGNIKGHPTDFIHEVQFTCHEEDFWNSFTNLRSSQIFTSKYFLQT